MTHDLDPASAARAEKFDIRNKVDDVNAYLQRVDVVDHDSDLGQSLIALAEQVLMKVRDEEDEPVYET